MPRRKVIRTFEEEEEYKCNKREKKAQSQAKRREIKREIAKKNYKTLSSSTQIYSNITQPSTSFSNITIIENKTELESVSSNINNNNKEIILLSTTQIYPDITQPSTSFSNITVIENETESESGFSNINNNNHNREIRWIQESQTNYKTPEVKQLMARNNCQFLSNFSQSLNITPPFTNFPNNVIVVNDKVVESESVLSNKIDKNRKINWIQRTRALKKGYININMFHITQIKNIEEHYIGEMNFCCEHCGAKHFISEKTINKGNSFNNCCNHGSVELYPLPQPPKELYELYTGNHPKSKHFYDRIRGYNNIFSFASFNANVANLSAQRRGPYCFKIQG